MRGARAVQRARTRWRPQGVQRCRALRPARADLGIHTQPITFCGLPALAVPLSRPGALPLGLQLIGRPGGEAMLMDYAAALERAGVTGFTAPERAHEGELA